MTEPTLGQSRYLTPAEVAVHLRVCRMTVYRMIADGSFPGTIRTGRTGRTIRIPEDALTAHLEHASQAAPAPVIPGQTEIPM